MGEARAQHADRLICTARMADGLLDCLLFWRDGALSSLPKLRDTPDELLLEAIGPIKLKG
jgi:hypothetical protein